MASLSRLVVESINDEFAYGMYGEFRVIIKKKNGYLNVTKLCALANKRFDNWMKNQCSKDMVDTVEDELEAIPLKRGIALDVIKGGNNDDKTNTVVSGTYAHPLLVPHIASWASPKFAMKVSRIMNDFLVAEHEKEIRKKHAIDLGIKNDRIDELIKKVDSQTAEIRQLLGYAKTADEKLDDAKLHREEIEGQLVAVTDQLDSANGHLEHVTEQLTTVNVQLDRVSEKLEVAKDERVPGKIQEPKLYEMLIIYKNNVTDKERTNSKSKLYDYKIFRVQKRIKNRQIESHRSQYQNTTELVVFERTPNSVDIYNRMKKQYSEMFEWNYTHFSLNEGVTERAFVEVLRGVYEDRKDV